MNLEPVDVLAFGAHPDDVELGCGGTLARLVQQGYRVGIVDLTEGEMASRGTVAERRRESAAAAQILGARWRHNAGLPDAHIQNSRENQILLIEVVRQARPALVFLPYPSDRHPDHVHASNLVKEACFYSGLAKIAPGLDAHRPRRLVFYPMTYEFTPSFIVNITDTFETKLKALQAYRSQFFNPNWPGPETFVSSQWFMEAVSFRARHFGWLAGVKYGEPFWVREHLALEDPFPILTTNRM
ncbi:MAG: bacillithiol biosynthesis deacetylase BshB1 [Calditrichaeota bacterium]|nr:MAG: bacillithiol biosynthesis deacetylase BshB1 [Calditrichota bacterium]